VRYKRKYRVSFPRLHFHILKRGVKKWHAYNR